jgi:acyl dehydratase
MGHVARDTAQQFQTMEEFRARVGATISTSHTHRISRADIMAFAGVTKDHQFIHVDEERAREGPFGGIIAHGMLTLSMISRMYEEAVRPLQGVATSINYGFDKVRFLSPVPAGSEIIGTFTLAGLEERRIGHMLCRYSVTIALTDTAKPALVADWLVMHVLDGA